jgi:hypothetical protein
MNIRERAMVLTGMAFPLGAILGVVFGRLTTPTSTGGGFGDIIYVLLWFVIGAPLFATAVYFWSIRNLEWDTDSRLRARFNVLVGIGLGTVAHIVMLVMIGRTGNTALLLVMLPIGALIVTLFARRGLKA